MAKLKVIDRPYAAHKNEAKAREFQQEVALANKSPPPRRKEASLPQAPEIEKAALASILQNPEKGFALFERIGRKGFFFSPVIKEIYALAKRFFVENGRLDLVVFTSELGDTGRLEALGGVSAITELFIANAPYDALEYYVEILREKYIERSLYSQAIDIISPKGHDSVTLDTISRRIEDLKRIACGGSNGCEQFELPKLLEFDTKRDPDCLVGYRWLNRGGAALWAGGSGYGKSSLEMQLAIYWACGVACFGMRPVRALKSMIIQAENDRGDTAEQLQGVMRGISNAGDLDLDARQELIQKHIVIYRVVGRTGAEFLGLLDNQIQFDRPDLVWIDPLFAFAGCDLLNPEKTGRFLREGLFTVANQRRVCINVLHHIGKPPRDPQRNGAMSELDYQYLGFGTSEIQNAFRAVNILVPVKKGGGFKLVLSKRGERAGAKDIEGDWAREIYIEHSKEGICWIQREAPTDTEGTTEKFTKQDILDEMSVIHPLKTDAVYKRCYREKNAKRATFFRLWGILKREKRIILSEGGWVRNNTSNETAPAEEPESQIRHETLIETQDETSEPERPF